MKSFYHPLFISWSERHYLQYNPWFTCWQHPLFLHPWFTYWPNPFFLHAWFTCWQTSWECTLYTYPGVLYNRSPSPKGQAIWLAGWGVDNQWITTPLTGLSSSHWGKDILYVRETRRDHTDSWMFSFVFYYFFLFMLSFFSFADIQNVAFEGDTYVIASSG
jgi:hypothetical protein